MQKRWAQKEEQVREEMKKARLGPGTNDFGAIQGLLSLLTKVGAKVLVLNLYFLLAFISLIN